MSKLAPPSIVVDCSVVADLLLTPSAVPADLGLIPTWHSPALMQCEFASVLRGHLLAGRIESEVAAALMSDVELLGVRLWPLERALGQRILRLAHNFSAYDAAYVRWPRRLRLPW